MEDLKKLLAAATPGPWYVGHNELGDAQGPMSIWPDANMIGAIIARCGPQQPWQGWYEQPAHDAALIVAAINALPGLIESAKRVEILAPYAKLGLAVSESWPSEFGDIDAFDAFDMLKESGVIVKQPEPYDPEHHDYIEDCEPGDEWYKRAVNIGNVRTALKGT